MKLGPGHIRDLTTPRYVERIKENRNGKYKVIVDTHSSIDAVISPKFTLDSDLSEKIDEMNTEYHNRIIKAILKLDLRDDFISYGNMLKQINRSSW